MPDKILCPWCGAEMKRDWRQTDYGEPSREVWFACENCKSNSPIAWGENYDEALKTATENALRRYTPPLKPMTLEASIEEKAVWIEQETNEPENNLTPSLFGWQNKGRWVVFIEQPGEDDDDGGKIVGYNPFDYGRTWRCWPRKPTKDEMEAAEWETYAL